MCEVIVVDDVEPLLRARAAGCRIVEYP